MVRCLPLLTVKYGLKGSKPSAEGDWASASESGPHLRSEQDYCYRTHSRAGSFGKMLKTPEQWEEYKVEESVGMDARRSQCDGRFLLSQSRIGRYRW